MGGGRASTYYSDRSGIYILILGNHGASSEFPSEKKSKFCILAHGLLLATV